MEMAGGSRSRPYYSRRCKKVRTSPTCIDSLPDDVLSEILVRVPADDLHDRAKLVCRRWSRTISSVAFAKENLDHSSYGLVLHVSGSIHPILASATKQGEIEVSSFTSCQYLISSCNGLVLEHPSPVIGSLHILNPIAKKSLLLPKFLSYKPSNRYRFIGAAFCATSTQLYKVVQVHMDRQRPDTPHLDILTVGVDSSWRQLPVEHFPVNRLYFSGARVDTERVIYWASRNILSLDMETEVITEISAPLPACASKKKLFYLSTGRHLSLLFCRRDSKWDVWEMQPGAGEWIKCTHFQFSSEQIHDHGRVVPCGWVNYPEVLACRTRTGTVIFYNLRTHEIGSTQVHDHIQTPTQPFPHRKSLQWLI